MKINLKKRERAMLENVNKLTLQETRGMTKKRMKKKFPRNLENQKINESESRQERKKDPNDMEYFS